jgi:transcription elongation factor GreA
VRDGEATEWMTLATQQRLMAELAAVEERLAREGERVREIAADTTWHGSNEVIPSLTQEMTALTRRIAALKSTLDRAVIYDPAAATAHVVGLGTRVTIVVEGEREEYLIVGHAEAAPSEGRISHHSPVGSALMGHRAGETVEAQTPGGSYTMLIEAIRPEL